MTSSAPSPLAAILVDSGPDWDRIGARRGLQPIPLARLAPWWHVDADLGRTQETCADLFDRLRLERIIP